jgi:hypothetical protein
MIQISQFSLLATRMTSAATIPLFARLTKLLSFTVHPEGLEVKRKSLFSEARPEILISGPEAPSIRWKIALPRPTS